MTRLHRLSFSGCLHYSIFPPSCNTRAQVHPAPPTPTESQSKWTKSELQPGAAHKSRAANSPQRTHKLDTARDAAKVAAKHAFKRARVTKLEPCAAYVGNIGPDVDEKALIAHFNSCGKILSARIHCCGGVSMTVKPPPASYTKNKNVRQYGIVVFGSKIARLRACKMGGTLGGREVTVSVAISDLPEVQEKVRMRLDDYRSRLEPLDVFRARERALRSLKAEPTVLLDPQRENERKSRNPFRIYGMSLRGGIM